MKVSQFVKWLSATANPDAIVKTFDPDSGRYEEVSGMVYDGAEVLLQTDEDDLDSVEGANYFNLKGEQK